MSKAPNEDKNTTFLRQCLTSPSVKADLSVLYSPNDLFVEQVEFEDMRTYHVYAQCSLPYGVCPYCGCVSHRVHGSLTLVYPKNSSKKVTETRLCLFFLSNIILIFVMY